MYTDIYKKLSEISHCVYGITIWKLFAADLPNEHAQKESNIPGGEFHS
jgi:hypothetical protein